ncbi:MAG: hypothetical protein FWC00_00220 [Firmicutes bacterium]|nr:hypothetical protein [Bacillota bacterium]
MKNSVLAVPGVNKGLLDGKVCEFFAYGVEVKKLGNGVTKQLGLFHKLGELNPFIYEITGESYTRVSEADAQYKELAAAFGG